MTFHWSVIVCGAISAICLINAGVFKAFSSFIMEALGRATPTSGVEVMQHINRAVLRTEFVFSLIALAPASLAFALYAYCVMQGWARTLIITAAVVYISTVFAVTMVGNIPLNNRLDAVDGTKPDTHAFWQVYLKDWTQLNHVRTIGSIITGGLYLIAALGLS